MIRRRPANTWLFCVALATGLFSPWVLAGPSVVPLRATIVFTEQVAPSTDPAEHCVLIGTISGSGVTTKLGPVQLASRDCINPVTPTSFLFLSDDVVLTVGGDEIWAAYGGTLSAADGAIKGTYFIFGGTGRFAHATGVGTLDGFEALDFATDAGRGQIQLKGTVAY
jgi:hypothetical protein